jgi:hypothetical protein
MPGRVVSRLPGSLGQLAYRDRCVARAEPAGAREAGTEEVSAGPDCTPTADATYSGRSTVDPCAVGDRQNSQQGRGQRARSDKPGTRPGWAAGIGDPAGAADKRGQA